MTRPSAWSPTIRFALGNWRVSALVLVPSSFFLWRRPALPVLTFAVAALSLVPLASLLGDSTEALAHRAGPVAGGLLNATLGNATEIIFGFIAIWAGHVEVVKASLAGSIIGNLLLVFGLAIFAGGMGREKQTFSRVSAGAGTAMLFVAVVALVMPGLFALSVFSRNTISAADIEKISLGTSIVLLVCYFAGLVYIFHARRGLFARELRPESELGRAAALILMLLTSLLIAFESGVLVGKLQSVTQALHWRESFVGLVIIATVGNAAEHSTAVLMARRDKMELALNVVMGSSTQIALFVAPLLIVASYLHAAPMSLAFPPLEIAAVVLSVAAVTLVSFDGETNWFEGVQLLSVYAILAVCFFFLSRP